jgi:hypothetical protein
MATATLNTVVKGDASQYHKTMDGVSDKAKQTTSAIGDLGKSIGGAFVVKRINDWMTELGKSAEAVTDVAAAFEISTERLRAIYAVGLFAGVDETQKIDVMLGKLDKKRQSALAGDRDAVASFAGLKVSMLDLAGPMDNLLDVVMKNAHALKANNDAMDGLYNIFGKNTGAMKKFFNEMKDGIDVAQEKYRELGLIIDDETTAKLTAWNEQQKQTTEVSKNLASVAVGYAVSLIGKLFEAMEKFDWWYQSKYSSASLLVDLATGIAPYRVSQGIVEELAGDGFPKSDVRLKSRYELEMSQPETIATAEGSEEWLKKRETERERLSVIVQKLEDARARVDAKTQKAGKNDGLFPGLSDKARDKVRDTFNQRLQSAVAALKEYEDETNVIYQRAADAEMTILNKQAEALDKAAKERKDRHDKELKEELRTIEERQKIYDDAGKEFDSAVKERMDIGADRDKIQAQFEKIRSGETLGAIDIRAADQVTKVGGLLGNQFAGLSDFGRMIQINEQIRDFQRDNNIKLSELANRFVDNIDRLNDATAAIEKFTTEVTE